MSYDESKNAQWPQTGHCGEMHAYLSLGRCPLTWPVPGQSLRNPLYCTPRGLVTGHQRLDQEDELWRREIAKDRRGVRGTGRAELCPTSAAPVSAFTCCDITHCSASFQHRLGLRTFTCAISMLSITGLMLLVVLIGWVCQAHCRLLGRGRRDKHSRPILESRGNPWHTSIIWQPCNRVTRKYFNDKVFKKSPTQDD